MRYTFRHPRRDGEQKQVWVDFAGPAQVGLGVDGGSFHYRYGEQHLDMPPAAATITEDRWEAARTTVRAPRLVREAARRAVRTAKGLLSAEPSGNPLAQVRLAAKRSAQRSRLVRYAPIPHGGLLFVHTRFGHEERAVVWQAGRGTVVVRRGG